LSIWYRPHSRVLFYSAFYQFFSFLHLILEYMLMPYRSWLRFFQSFHFFGYLGWLCFPEKWLLLSCCMLSSHRQIRGSFSKNDQWWKICFHILYEHFILSKTLNLTVRSNTINYQDSTKSSSIRISINFDENQSRWQRLDSMSSTWFGRLVLRV